MQRIRDNIWIIIFWMEDVLFQTIQLKIAYVHFVQVVKSGYLQDTPKGAEASAAVYSIIETAKENGLNVYTYLEYLLMYMPDTEYHNYPEDLDLLMPWSETVQAECGK